jgi:phosphopantetheinyl transferase
MRDVHEKYMRADMDIIRADGQLLMRLEGWCDWRFYCPEEAYEFFRFPSEGVVSKLLAAPVAKFSSPDEFECRAAGLDEMFSRDALAFWLKAWGRLLLNHRERHEFYRLDGPEQRRVEWLLARAAAKDAIRSWLKKRHGLCVYPADIEIANDENGRPEPRGYWRQQIGYTPALAVSYSSQLAIAIVGPCAPHQCLGVDVQEIESRSMDFDAVAFTSPECSMLDRIGSPAQQEWLTRFWCAKEAVGRALGRGLPYGPQSVLVQSIDTEGGVVTVTLGDKLASELPEFTGVPIAIYTTRHREFVIATTLCERA